MPDQTAAPPSSSPIDKSECPNCGKQIDKSQFGCSRCWFQLPNDLRRRVWANYRKPYGERLRGLPALYAEAMEVWGGA
jgi:predicted amidophosphoribosyltransferase